MAREKRKIKVLLADDSRSMRSLIRSAFPYGQDHPDFVEVSTGGEAVSAYQAQRFDIVLLDIRMPGRIDGLGALQAIRTYDEDAFVIMISGDLTPESIQIARSAGAVSVVRKPVSQQVAKDILQAYLGRTRRRASILAVDDCHDIIAALNQGLSILKIQHRMYRAETIAEARRAFDSIHFDLFFIDSHLGGDEGLKLMGTIKTSRPTTYLVVFTTDSTRDSVLSAREQGADDYLLKSVDLVQLAKVWNRFVVASKEELLTGRRLIPVSE
jgi:two-component system chemotaxis response regulator CheY